eukprot:scpid102746/ scgid5360/ Vesicle transport protein USE1; USE1-like protein
MASRVETNFKRLLSKCESMVAEEIRAEDLWRLEQFISRLTEDLAQLEKSPSRPKGETLVYSKRLQVLNEFYRARQESLESTRNDASIPATNPFANTLSAKSREAQMKACGRHLGGMRSELLEGRNSLSRESSTPTADSGVRHRSARAELIGKADGTSEAATTTLAGTGATTARQPHQRGDDLEGTMQVHRQKQEEIAEDMVQLARTLKLSQRRAKDTIEEDTRTLQKSADKAQESGDKLRTETGRIQQHTRKSCSYWTWIMIICVAITFIAMVIFIRIVPKK